MTAPSASALRPRARLSEQRMDPQGRVSKIGDGVKRTYSGTSIKRIGMPARSPKEREMKGLDDRVIESPPSRGHCRRIRKSRLCAGCDLSKDSGERRGKMR
jgi:hypothetical protein